MSEDWVRLLADNLPDAIKIIGPVFFTALVAIYTVWRQSSVSIELQRMQLQMQIRERVFEFYKEEMIRAEDNAAKAVSACAQLVGGMVAEELVSDEPQYEISTDSIRFFESSSAVVPITSNRICSDLSEFGSKYEDFLKLLKKRTAELESFTLPLSRLDYKGFATTLADVLHLQGQCYSSLMQEYALDILRDGDVKRLKPKRYAFWKI